HAATNEDWTREIDLYYVYTDPVSGCVHRVGQTVTVYNRPSATLQVQNSCAPSNLSLYIEGNWGSYPDLFHYDWYKDGILVQSSNSEVLNNAGSGNYVVRMRFPDAPTGCYTEQSVQVTACCVSNPSQVTYNKRFIDPNFPREFIPVSIQSLPNGGAI